MIKLLEFTEVGGNLAQLKLERQTWKGNELLYVRSMEEKVLVKKEAREGMQQNHFEEREATSNGRVV